MSPLEHPYTPFEEEAIEQSIPNRFAQQVKAYGDQIAVHTLDKAITYRALDRLANSIAWALLDISDDPEHPVALLLDDSVYMIAGILGVLKAGKCYAPIDLKFADEQRKRILQESTARILRTTFCEDWSKTRWRG